MPGVFVGRQRQAALVDLDSSALDEDAGIDVAVQFVGPVAGFSDGL